MCKTCCLCDGPLPVTEHEKMYLMIVIDYFSKLLEANALPYEEAVTVAMHVKPQR